MKVDLKVEVEAEVKYRIVADRRLEPLGAL